MTNGSAPPSAEQELLRLTRALWAAGEMVHDATYFAPQTRAEADRAGLRGGWMAYFGFRAAPLGAVSAATVCATFYGFAPAMVARSVPDVWAYASPETLLAARLRAVDAALTGALRPGAPDGVPVSALRRAADLAVTAAAAADVAGRPLAAANAALPVPEAPHLALWQALTTLREHRGDGHVALLVCERIDPVESHVLAAASGRAPAEMLRANRRWGEDDWHDAERRLQARGWLTLDASLTDEGAAARARLEDATDRLAAGPYRALGPTGAAELLDLLTPLAHRLVGAGVVPLPNPTGVAWTAAPDPS